jgi:hypothetical protein
VVILLGYLFILLSGGTRVGFFVENCALHTSHTLVTRTWDHRAPTQWLRELVTLI